MQLKILSFGFKFGLPRDLDLCLDVRFLKNPFYECSLKSMSGLEAQVKQFVLAQKDAQIFLYKAQDLLDFLIPLYGMEGRKYLTIGVGCTGGRHRSVVIAESLFEHHKYQNIASSLVHRDVDIEGLPEDLNCP